ncbi:MAG: hypothetical protein ACRC85_18730 [Kluyvera ascorbata]
MNIKFEYYSFLLDEQTVKEITRELEKNSINLITYDKSNVLQMSMDEIISQLLIHIPPEIVNSLTVGLITNTAYDAIKNSIKLVLRDLKGKFYKKINSNGKTEEKKANLGIQFKKNNNSFYLNLSPDLSIELQDKCIEKAFELMAEQENDTDINNLLDSEVIIGTFNNTTLQWERKTLHDIIKKKNKL